MKMTMGSLLVALAVLATSCAGPEKVEAAKAPPPPAPEGESYSATEGGEGKERTVKSPTSVDTITKLPPPVPTGRKKVALTRDGKIAKPRPVSSSNLPALLEEIEAKYATASTLSAEFTQVNQMAALGQTKSSQGTILAKRPGKMRWETVQPDKNLLVSDGKTLWFYTPPFDETEHGQVIERKSSEAQSKLANALLSGSFSMARDMKIQQKSPSEFVLLPKRGTAGTVSRAEIAINLDRKVIEKVTLEHQGGNRSEISLQSIELGKELDDGLFKFVAPPNTDKVDP